jgi:hypothetical protein
MNTKSSCWSRGVGGFVALLIVSGCAVTGVGYGYDAEGYVGGVYEPYGYDYGGWGGRYRVGPPRGDYHGGDRRGGDRGGGHGGHGAPSIPSGPRGGGGHTGHGH